jgi:hypothetical protein
MYEINNTPLTFADVFRELRKIQEQLNGSFSKMTLDTLYAEPAKPREGDIVLADGTSWDPGSGAGTYQYRGGTWNLLG